MIEKNFYKTCAYDFIIFFFFLLSGCLLDSAAPRVPPDVPPRNPTMSRLNGRLPGNHVVSDHERDPDLEPNCLVRTPSGNFYNISSEFIYFYFFFVTKQLHTM